ncbi:hypothetical protein Taro_049608 [Colocasia esculenta]|uniref:Uncharacterized protein n=1 Tax=Colocasia esculenta TaxID=4460 RepID=A0A843XB86_COLES|nr:hypothetical protein [Colocasia esculenta]
MKQENASCANRPLGVDQRRVRDPRHVSSMKAAALLDVILTFPRFAGFHCAMCFEVRPLCWMHISRHTRGCMLMDAWLNSLNMTDNPAFEYEDNVHDEFVGMVDTNVQPKESVQSSSQADNEGSVSLRVNPTYAQDIQEDPEFSKLLSHYSPEDIISMLSKHTVRAAASPSPPSPPPFYTSSSRPTPRPVTPSRAPISPIPISTPLATPVPPLSPFPGRRWRVLLGDSWLSLCPSPSLILSRTTASSPSRF